MLLHEVEEFYEDIMAVLQTMNISICVGQKEACSHTFAVVLLHAGKALCAASMASLVSSRPISGTVPSSSLVAGSAVKGRS